MTQPRAHQTGLVPPRYSEAEASRWLTWLARNMQRHGQSVFLIERLQPSWFDTPRQRWLNLLLYSVLFGLFIGAVLYTTWDVAARIDPGKIKFPDAAIPKFMVLWVTATLWSLFAGGVDMQRPAWLAASAQDGALARYRKLVLRFLLFCAAWGLIWEGAWGLTFLLGSGDQAEFFTLTVQQHPLIGGLVFVLVYMGRVQEQYIGTVEALGLSWKRAVLWAVAGLGCSLVVWYLFKILSPNLTEEQINENLRLYPPLGIVAGFMLGLLTFRLREQKTRPNQGIRLSVINMMKAGPLIGVVMSVTFWVIFMYGPFGEDGQAHAVEGTIVFGLTCLFGAMLWYGGFDAFRHYVLRAVLALSGQFPLRLARFLDYAAHNLQFLQKVGGGYMFIHRYLLEHFAALKADPSSPETTGHPAGE